MRLWLTGERVLHDPTIVITDANVTADQQTEICMHFLMFHCLAESWSLDYC